MSETLIHALRAIVRDHAQRPAIITPERTWTFADFDAETDRFARALVERVGPPGACVAVAFPTGPEALLATWAILKAGCIQTPLDPGWPPARMASAMAHVEPVLVIRDEHIALPAGTVPGITLNELNNSGSRLPALDDARAIAVIHLTSGRTGAPKGVMLSHACWVHSARNYQQHLQLTPGDRMSWTAPFAYGAAAGTYFAGTLSGAALLPIRPEVQRIAEWSEWIDRQRAGVMMISTSLFRTLARHLQEGPNFPHLRIVKLGGEPAYPADAQLFYRRFAPTCTLMNGLGITESGTNVCFYRCARETLPAEPTIPVGYASTDMELFVLDERGVPLPAGRAGEIAVRSAWLADGYWKDPNLTAQRWLRTPGEARATLRTGDWGRMTEDGCLVHLGSIETRLKVRGYRVEAVEVESALRSLAGVDDAAVSVRTLGESEKLVAWLEGDRAERWTTSAVRRELSGRLTEAMLPSIIQAGELPRLPNGKLDRAALSTRPLQRGGTAVLGDDSIEQQLAVLWEKTLGIRGIGRDDNFYDLGGDSLDAVSLFTRIEQRLGVSLDLLHISSCPTIGAMADRLRKGGASAPSPSIVLLQIGDGRANFFCGPGGGCDAASLIDLARALGTRAHFYALQYSGMDGVNPPAQTVEEQATVWLREIRRIQPSGPYVLGGASLGGLVMMEVAQRLCEQGELVTRLVLLDTYGPGSVDPRPGLNPGQRLRLLWLRLSPPRHRRRETSRAYALVRWLRHRSLALRAAWWQWRERDYARLPNVLRFEYHMQLGKRISGRYQPRPLFVPVDLVTAQERLAPDLLMMPEDLGWGAYCKGGLNHYIVPGSHSTMLREPHVARTAQCFSDAIAGTLDSRAAVHDDARKRWNDLADWWDGQVGQQGESPAAALLSPDVTELLGPVSERRVLELACGNGWYARQLAASGAHVIATDFSARQLEHARRRTGDSSRVDYRLLDVTREADWRALPESRLDAAVCLMGLMDMANVTLLFCELAARLAPGAPFVFSMLNPDDPKLAHVQPGHEIRGIGLPGQPTPHYYFHRPRHELLAEAERAGFRVDCVLERDAPASANLVVSRFLLARLIAPPREAGPIPCSD